MKESLEEMKTILRYFVVTSSSSVFTKEIENIILNEVFWNDASEKYFLLQPIKKWFYSVNEKLTKLSEVRHI